MRKHIPKVFTYGPSSRAAAIWALGHLYENKPDMELSQLLADRMADVGSLPPEQLNVQTMCAVSLGRMGAKSFIPLMRKLVGKETGPTMPHLAIRWAVVKLGGEPIQDIIPYRVSKSAWFLTPLEDDPDQQQKP
jgi:hypothetical protein